jgi:hypothetical protein
VNSTTTDVLRSPSDDDEIGVERRIVVGILEGAVDAGKAVELRDEEGTDVNLCDVGAGVELDIVVAWTVVVSAPAPAVLELLPNEHGVELHVVGAGVLDDDAAGVLPPPVPDADVLPILPSTVVVSAPAPAMLEMPPYEYGVELHVVGAGVLDDDAAGVLPPPVPGADVLPILPSAIVVSAPAPAMVDNVVEGVPVDKEEENTVVGEDEAMTLVVEVSVSQAVVTIPVVRAAVVDEFAAGGAI